MCSGPDPVWRSFSAGLWRTDRKCVREELVAQSWHEVMHQCVNVMNSWQWGPVWRSNMGLCGRLPKSVTNKHLMRNLVGPLHHSKAASQREKWQMEIWTQRHKDTRNVTKERNKSDWPCGLQFTSVAVVRQGCVSAFRLSQNQRKWEEEGVSVHTVSDGFFICTPDTNNTCWINCVYK